MNNEDLIKKIETVRKKMISVGMSNGFTSPETIKLSQTLDNLFNLGRGLLR
ncbi:aspartyl-phosphate phosphatase Spo0E family protein [Neobacillus pocheonensis]|uniref:Aspartyl-phosphate phosphatase Spo0E family protein n=1 Tax=Neobacillus pocheonensis TaxID=363869 RepID=A0ABT0WG54_9BACI|nr:aspartyl-phosphate phosphatase Spo0E family protein [Neobacillus pocheonensis]